jgi:hypothetical protein
LATTADTVFEDMTERERILFAEAKLGLDIEHFLKSDVGRLLRGRAAQEIEEAKEGLLECNPNTFFGRRRIRKLQNRAELANMFTTWCAEAIMGGRNAEIQLQDDEGDQ